MSEVKDCVVCGEKADGYTCGDGYICGKCAHRDAFGWRLDVLLGRNDEPEEDRLTPTSPERIWLQIDAGDPDRSQPFPDDHDGITWCAEPVGGAEVEYERADLVRRQNAQTKGQVEMAFRSELQALLDKYGADLEADDHYQGYAECGKDIRMTVYIKGLWDKGGIMVREFTEIDLGRCLGHTNDRP